MRPLAGVTLPNFHATRPRRAGRSQMPGPYRHFDRLEAACAGLAPMPTAIVCPDDALSLQGALATMRAGFIVPLLIGDAAKIRAAADAAGVDLDGIELIDACDAAGSSSAPGSAAAAAAVALVQQGRARAIMKGNLHSDTLLGQIVRREGGMRTGRRLSHAFVTDMPGFDRLVHVTDGALNIAPDLATKVDIAINAIELAAACGAQPPRVAVLAAVETVNPQMPASVDAALIARMADRDQITGLPAGGVLIDGPLAMDNAIDAAAARTKRIRSEVAGRADVLLVPDIEAGNMVVKALTFIAGAETAGLVLGGRVPVMLTSRADSPRARLVSCVLGLLLDDYRSTGRSRVAAPATAG
ncbi:MAG TPA: bifunctional enoyl-CoA hydratase/phosphate acetyltransferase [Burkholderiaceae bacterium]|nr:bifunctional enoyl-CoA hydratase/phosphate acetyltransferase [Burkholderiaceae bacterium]